MSLEEINKDAQERFAKLKHKMKLDLGLSVINTALEIDKAPKIDMNKLQEIADKQIPPEGHESLLNKPSNKAQKEMDKLKDVTNFVNNSFSFIDSLNLPPQLSLAMGLIISYGKTKNHEDLDRAIAALEEAGEL